MTQPFQDDLQPRSVASTRSSKLSSDDQHHLAQLEAKLQIVRDRVTAVANGYATGLYLYGDGGVGKSYTVLQELQRLRSDFVAFNSRMTGRGLYEQLEKFPHSVHVLEDMEGLFRDKGAQGVLRSALWAQRQEGSRGRLERRVTWITHAEENEVIFHGGIIVIGNRAIDDVPELHAVKTRIACLHLEVTGHEIQALMRQVAGKGYDHAGIRLEPTTCREVCEYLIQESLSLRHPLNMRLLINSFHDRVQWEQADAVCHWKDLVATRLRERPTALPNREVLRSREGQKRWEQAIVAEILAASQSPPEQVRLWSERTGKSPAAWYRRLAELTRR